MHYQAVVSLESISFILSFVTDTTKDESWKASQLQLQLFRQMYLEVGRIAQHLAVFRLHCTFWTVCCCESRIMYMCYSNMGDALC